MNSDYKQLRGLLNSNGMITIKAFFGNQIRRVPILNPELTFDELCLMVYLNLLLFAYSGNQY
jgi:hypothetical protein